MADNSSRVLIIGATSAIAHALARRYASAGARLFVLARDAARLQANAADLRVRGAAEVRTALLDVLHIEQHMAVLQDAFATWGGFDVALLAHGSLPDQAACEQSTALSLAAFDLNGRCTVALLTELANHFERQGSGVLAVISSPAGERGRASNYVYGAAKAAVSVMLSGLRHRLTTKGVRVVNILPGFVDTPMTANMPKGAMWASPERVAADIEAALRQRNATLYTPWFWRWIMLIVRHLPEWLFLKTRL
jgi:decaprenylphospho-beta-D-erythro-pentofuranosid-2-ulose 2-reductase